jgi:hypothetical protein
MLRYGTFAIVLILVPGCFLFFPPEQNGDATGSSELKPFDSEKELTDYFVNQITGRNNQIDRDTEFERAESDAVAALEGAPQSPADGDFATDAPGASGPSPTGDDGAALNTGGSADSEGSFSGTTTQVLGVDEADVVKTDGEFLYIITDQMLRIVRVTPREQFGLVSETALEGVGREIYLHDGMVVALTETYGRFFGWSGGGGFPEPAILVETLPSVDPETPVADTDTRDDGVAPSDDLDMIATDEIAPPDFSYERPSTYVTILDVTTPDQPVEITRTRFDGSQSSSRMIDGVMRLVVAISQHDYFDVLPLLGRPELDLSQVDDDDLLPTYEQRRGDTTTSGPLVTWESVYRPTDPDGFGIVAVVTMDTNDRSGAFSAVGVVAEPGLIYSSTEALYLTDYWSFFGNTRDTTDIYKFAYGETSAVPVATGTVPGRIDSQYHMDEYQGHLRVATTLARSFEPSFPFGDVVQTREQSSAVYVLETVGSKLSVAGKIENIAPGETLQSARFLDDRGFVVTFRVVDPLFTLNLADPRNPKIEGELKIPGFSTFIVPMDRDHLLTVGQYIPENGPFFGRGVQLSVFDISNLQQPTLKHLEVIGGVDGAGSEALRNPKAFTYFAEQSLLALPIEIYDYGFTFIDGPFFGEDDVVAVDGGMVEPGLIEPAQADGGIAADEEFVSEAFYGLLVYRVSTDGGFEALGRISTVYVDNFYWTAFTRGVFIDDDVFAATNRGVRGATVADLATVTHEVQFKETLPDDIFEEPINGADGVVINSRPVP